MLACNKTQPSVTLKQLCGQLVVTTSKAAMTSSTAVPAAEAAVSSAEAAVPSAEVSSAMSAANEDWSAAADPEYRWREKSAVQGVQRRNLLIVRLRGILRGVALLTLRHLVPVVVALVAFVDA